MSDKPDVPKNVDVFLTLLKFNQDAYAMNSAILTLLIDIKSHLLNLDREIVKEEIMKKFNESHKESYDLLVDADEMDRLRKETKS